ncbi:MAG: AAA family ATPase [Desulfurococcaceae archaeon]
MANLYLLVAGMPGAGKSILTEVAREMGIPVYTMGDVVREETLKRFGKITPDLMVGTSVDLRREWGDDIIALRTLSKIEGQHSVVLIDGVRSLGEVEAFRARGETVVIAVHASPRTRFKRLLERKRPGDPSTYEEFSSRDLIELGYGLGNVIALADYMIVNEGTIDEAKIVMRSILSDISSKLVKDNGGDHC